jgi:hypothetical protein
MSFKIIAEAEVNPTEDIVKVKKALQTIIPKREAELSDFGTQKYLRIESSDVSSLDALYAYFREQRILDAARKTLHNGRIGNSTVFFVNKQVAFVGKINFCDMEGESPLGPIKVEIRYETINYLIDWLAPPTEKGEEITLVRDFP